MNKEELGGTTTAGRAFRQRRLELGKSLVEIASKIRTKGGKKKMATSYLAQIETEQKTPSLEVAEQITKELGLDFKPIAHAIIIKKLGEPISPTSSTIKLKTHSIVVIPNK